MAKVKAIVVQDDCPHCEELVRLIRERKLRVKIIDASTKKGKEFADKHGIEYVPECVVIEKADGEKIKVCSPSEFKKLLEEGR